jgi:hypothetical protein
LEVAFESPHVFMAFKKILAKEPQELERFKTYRENQIRERIDEWLAANNYLHDPDFVNPIDENPDEDEEDLADEYRNDEEDDEDDRLLDDDSEDFSPRK